MGYNVIEELVKSVDVCDEKSVHMSSIEASFREFDKDILMQLIELIVEEKTDELCTIKSPKRDVIIPAQRAIKVNCRANTGPVEETTPVFFEPDELGPWPDGLKVYETLTTITQGSMSK